MAQSRTLRLWQMFAVSLMLGCVASAQASRVCLSVDSQYKASRAGQICARAVQKLCSALEACQKSDAAQTLNVEICVAKQDSLEAAWDLRGCTPCLKQESALDRKLKACQRSAKPR